MSGSATQARPTEAPLEAFRWQAPAQFRDAAGDERSAPNEWPIEIQARTPGVVDHWFWGRMVHDMAGVRHRDAVPLDWRHDPDEVLGWADSVTADENGLRLSGRIQSTREGDRAFDVGTRGKAGQPYEASIYWDEYDHVLEFLDEGFVATVNGQQVEGPLIIAREWTLRGVAITPYGVDHTTRTKFSADSPAAVPVNFSPFQGDPMSKEATKDAATKPADQQTQPQTTKDAATKPAEQPTQPNQPTQPVQHQDAGRAELARYMDTFGPERGAGYYRDGVEFQDALGRELKELRAENATKDAALAEAQQKLSAVQVGETTPVDTGTTKDEAKPTGWGAVIRKR